MSVGVGLQDCGSKCNVEVSRMDMFCMSVLLDILQWYVLSIAVVIEVSTAVSIAL